MLKKILLFLILILSSINIVYSGGMTYTETNSVSWNYEFWFSSTTDSNTLQNNLISSGGPFISGDAVYTDQVGNARLFRFPDSTEDLTFKKASTDLSVAGIGGPTNFNFEKYRIDSGPNNYELSSGTCRATSITSPSFGTIDIQSNLNNLQTTAGAQIVNEEIVIPHLLERYYYMKTFVFLQVISAGGEEYFVAPDSPVGDYTFNEDSYNQAGASATTSTQMTFLGYPYNLAYSDLNNGNAQAPYTLLTPNTVSVSFENNLNNTLNTIQALCDSGDTSSCDTFTINAYAVPIDGKCDFDPAPTSSGILSFGDEFTPLAVTIDTVDILEPVPTITHFNINTTSVQNNEVFRISFNSADTTQCELVDLNDGSIIINYASDTTLANPSVSITDSESHSYQLTCRNALGTETLPETLTVGAYDLVLYNTSSPYYNVKLNNEFRILGYDLTVPQNLSVFIQPNTMIGSRRSNVAALRTGLFFPGSNLEIINEGSIVGKGGDGGSAPIEGKGNPGERGGPAIYIKTNTTIDNWGFIVGGSGGGGSSSGGYGTTVVTTSGGGGGSGFVPGLGGEGQLPGSDAVWNFISISNGSGGNANAGDGGFSGYAGNDGIGLLPFLEGGRGGPAGPGIVYHEGLFYESPLHAMTGDEPYRQLPALCSNPLQVRDPATDLCVYPNQKEVSEVIVFDEKLRKGNFYCNYDADNNVLTIETLNKENSTLVNSWDVRYFIGRSSTNSLTPSRLGDQEYYLEEFNNPLGFYGLYMENYSSPDNTLLAYCKIDYLYSIDLNETEDVFILTYNATEDLYSYTTTQTQNYFAIDSSGDIFYINETTQTPFSLPDITNPGLISKFVDNELITRENQSLEKIALYIHELKLFNDFSEATSELINSINLMIQYNITLNISSNYNLNFTNWNNEQNYSPYFSEGKTSTVKISLDGAPRENLTVYYILPKYVAPDISYINFISDGGGQRIVLDKDPIIGWYFNDSDGNEEIEIEVPGDGDGEIIITKEPVLFNEGDLIVNYRESSCNPGEAHLFDLEALVGSRILAPGSSLYKVCVAHVSEDLYNSSIYSNDLNILSFNSVDGHNSLLAQGLTPFENMINISTSNSSIYWDIKIQEDNPYGTYTCLGSVTETHNSLFGDCGYNSSNRIWIHLDEDLAPPQTTLSYPYLANSIAVTLDALDYGSGVNRVYYCVDYNDTCTPGSNGEQFGIVSTSNQATFSFSCPNAWGCISFVRFYSVDNAGNVEPTNSEGIKMLDVGSSCQSDCTAQPSPNRIVGDCRNLNGCTFYPINGITGLFDDGYHVSQICDLSLKGSYIKYNATHEIQCPQGPFRFTKFVDQKIKIESTNSCEITYSFEYPVIIDGKSVLLKVISCLF